MVALKLNINYTDKNLELLDRYKVIMQNKGLTIESQKAFEYDIKLFLRYIGNKALKKITADDIEDFFYHCQTVRKKQSMCNRKKAYSLKHFL